jgi:hypothetical protein
MENLLDNKMNSQKATLAETLKGVAIIFGSVIFLGFLADTFLKGEEKAEEARRAGYDI